MKCDVIIPVYKAPEWVKLCVYALFTNTDTKLINKVFLVNDCDDPFTTNCLKNLKAKYGNKLIIKQNKQNLGFVKTVNRGLKLTTADCVLLLNSDCLLAKNSILKLMQHLKNDPDIGLICPLASNAANLTVPIPEGWNYSQIDALFEKHFSGKNFNACTVVGNCLMITKKCIEKVGYLDEAYGTGYGEETDYQFKAMAKGFTAKVAIDTYVFHKAEASFGTSKEKQERLKKNRDLFFSRWGEQYKTELKQYEQNDPIKYINSHLTAKDWQPSADTLFYLDGIVQNAGGVHIVVDIVNYLTINGESINITYNLQYPYQEITLFTPIISTKVNKIKTKQLVSTVWKTAFAARKIADQKHIKLISFVQGFEGYFENGTIYGGVETSYKLADNILTISNYLEKELQKTFDQKSHIIPNGINYDLLHVDPSQYHNTETTITIVLRNNIMKGDWLAIDIIKRLSKLNKKITVNLVSINEYIMLPKANTDKNVKINLIKGPLNRCAIYQLLQNSDLYIDTSLSEGFGLTALESMTASCIPIVADSIGIHEYLKNNKNGLIINKVNYPQLYINAIKTILDDKNLSEKLLDEGQKTAIEHDFDNLVPQYINYFNNVKNQKSCRQPLTKQDVEIITGMQQERKSHTKKIIAFEIAKKVTPKPIKYKAVSLIEKLHKYITQ